MCMFRSVPASGDDQYIQILSGLTDGDVIGYDPSTLTNAGYYGGAAVTMTDNGGLIHERTDRV